MLEEPSLTCIRIDDRSHLEFGSLSVVIAAPFTLGSDGTVHHLDPVRTDRLGPFASLYPGAARWVWATTDDVLHVVFENGAWLRVGPDHHGEAWWIGDGGPEVVPGG